LPGFSGLTFSGTRRPGFSGRICCFWPGIYGLSFSGMGNLKKLYGQQAKLFWYLQRDFLSLIREFSGGKLKQKGFFHSAGMLAIYRRENFISNKKNGGEIKNSFYHPRSIYLSRPIQQYHFQANLIWCEGTFNNHI
jgi:hypothetical protein